MPKLSDISGSKESVGMLREHVTQTLLVEGFNNVLFMAEPDLEAREGVLRHDLGVVAEKLDIRRLADLTFG
jgi:hypothetical protein